MRPCKLRDFCLRGPMRAGRSLIWSASGANGIYLITGRYGGRGRRRSSTRSPSRFTGEASGANREAGHAAVKIRGSPGTPTFVELTFTYGDRRYTVRRNPEYERPAKRAAAACYPEGGRGARPARRPPDYEGTGGKRGRPGNPRVEIETSFPRSP